MIIDKRLLSRQLALLVTVLFFTTAILDVQCAQAHDQLKPKQIKTFKQLSRILSSKTVHRPFLIAKESGDAIFAATPNATGGIEHSDTNVQVEGVDEGDIVKTDGDYIYRVQSGKVQIVRAYPANKMELVSELSFNTEFYPIEMYLAGNQLVVVGSGWYPDKSKSDVPVMTQGKMAVLPVWAPSGESRTTAKIYDISDRAKPALAREVTFSGDYLSSRRIDNKVYLVGRKYPNYFLYAMRESASTNPAPGKKGKLNPMKPVDLLPKVSDTVDGFTNSYLLPVRNIYYLPGSNEPDYVIVAGFKLDDPSQKADIKAYLGSGDIVYASSQNLYLSAADYSNNNVPENTVTSAQTRLFKFALGDGSLRFTAAGKVPGTVLNSFSMDEYNGYFRIATTTDQWSLSGDTSTNQSWNNLYTLDADMAVTGRLEKMAEGERIYSVRFMGERAYVVTFKQVDPLIVIDLSEPSQLAVLGELKIPGFSTYLHPFDANHIIGFGNDTEETETGIRTSGLKLALFDVSDVAHPTQKHSLNIGDAGTYSELLYNHKALLFNKTTGLFGFPVSVTAKKPGEEWPAEIFQGAYVYKISLDKGFQKLAQISHRDEKNPYDWSHVIQRLLTIDKNLYTLSEARIQANALAEFGISGALDFYIPPPPSGCEPGTGVNPLAEIAIDCPILIDPLPVNPQ